MNSILLPSVHSPAYIAIFEDALDQLGVLGDISLDVSKGDAKVVCSTNLVMEHVIAPPTNILAPTSMHSSLYH
jgi:hypothetical protein